MLNGQALSILSLGLVLAGCKVSPPGNLETATMTKIKHSITVRDKDVRNRLPATPANVENGRIAFSHYCVACHGLDGQNTGVPFADRMAPPVPPINSPAVQSYTDGQLHWIMVNGLFPSGMPASKGILTDEELWSIVVYVRHLPPAGSLGEPAIYSGDDTPPCPTPPQSR
jgi:cytochrome c